MMKTRIRKTCMKSKDVSSNKILKSSNGIERLELSKLDNKYAKKLRPKRINVLKEETVNFVGYAWENFDEQYGDIYNDFNDDLRENDDFTNNAVEKRYVMDYIKTNDFWNRLYKNFPKSKGNVMW